jgi:1-hydroxycarotenoid 3,4-desaturase
VIVVGAGIGGLSCAVALAAAGVRVRVLEKSDAPGGKARRVRTGSREIDAGPTVLTMPWVFDELFASAGASFRDAVPLARASMLARHAWRDGTRLDLHAERALSADAIGAAFGSSEARAFVAFSEDARKIYELSEEAFIRAQRPTLPGIMKRWGAAGLSALARIDAHRSLARALEQRFTEPKLRQLFGRYATYCGSSPFEAPGTLKLVAHVEAEGVWRPEGGMHAIGRALAALAASLGVELRWGEAVTKIEVERGRATAVVTDVERHAADAIVWNGDVAALAEGLAGEAATRAAAVVPRDARSLSAVTWTMNARPRGFPLVHHNVFFSDDYPAEFDAIFRRARVPDAPTVYICAQDRGDDDRPLAEDERLLVLVNAPATGDVPGRWTESEKERCTTAMEKLLERSGLTLDPQDSVATTPAEFHSLYPGTGGALYGARSKGAFSAMARAGASSKIPRLYLAGGSVHPGPGVPMAALSGRLAAAQLCEDLASIARSRPAAITGTISTD